MNIEYLIEKLVWVLVLIVMEAIAEECWVATLCDGQPSWTRLTPNWKNGSSECQHQLTEMLGRLKIAEEKYSALGKVIDLLGAKKAATTKPNKNIEVHFNCSGKGGTTTIYPWKDDGDLHSVDVNSDLYSVDKDGWITIQKRFDGSVRFHDRNWEDYAGGFGNKSGEFWLGLRTIHQLTTTKNYKLRVNWVAKRYGKDELEYSTFKVGSEEEKFRLLISQLPSGSGDVMKYFNGSYFSTVDVDNDRNSGESCAQVYDNGGWWYGDCNYHKYNFYLNGKYNYLHYPFSFPLKSSEMKIHLV